MKVSIITVCLNSEDTIERTINSVLSQSYPHIEYIVIDGGSVDRTINIIGQYKEKISKYISEKDEGIYDAMNKGLSFATGDIVGFLNSDDYYVNERVIELIVGFMVADDVCCCYGDLEYVTRKKPDKVVRSWRSRPYEDGLFKKGWHPPHPTFFVRRHIFKKYGKFDLYYKISADYELMLRLLKKYKVKSCYIPNVLVKMRPAGISNKSLLHILRANIECYRAWRRNNLEISPLVVLRKPLSKLAQVLRKD